MSITLYNNIKYKYNNKNNINKEIIEERNIEFNKYKINNLNFKIYNEENNDCCICLNELMLEKKTNIKNNDKNIINNIDLLLLECGHYFHLYCIYNPINNNLNIKNCPLCREPIKNIIPSNIREYKLYNLIINNQLMNKFFDNLFYNEKEIFNIIHNFINHNIELECMKIFQYEIFNNKYNNKCTYYFKNKEEILPLININDIIQFIYIISNKFMNTYNINLFFKIYDNSQIKNINWLNHEQYFILNILFYKIVAIMINEHIYIEKLMFIKNLYSNTFLYNLRIIDKNITGKINLYFNKINNIIGENYKVLLEIQSNNNIYHTLFSNIFNYTIFNFISSNKNYHKYIELRNNNNDTPLSNFLKNNSFIKLSPIKYIQVIIKKFSNDDLLQSINNNPLYTFILNCLINNKFYDNLSIKKIINIITLLIDKNKNVLSYKLFNNNYTLLSFYILHINKFNDTYSYLNDNNTIYCNTNPAIVKQKNHEIIKIIELLICENQSNLFDVDNLNKTPLHLAIERKFSNFKLLIDRHKKLLFYKDTKDLLPIHYFILNNTRAIFNSQFIHHLIDKDKKILYYQSTSSYSQESYNNNILQFYLNEYNHLNIRLYFIKTLKNNDDNILLHQNSNMMIPIMVYLSYSYISYEILIELIDKEKTVLYQYCNNSEKHFDNPLIMYFKNCINVDEKCIRLLTNNYDEKILNYQNYQGNIALNIFIDSHFNKLHNNAPKKFLNIFKSLITKDNICLTNVNNYNSLQFYLQCFLYLCEHRYLNMCNIINLDIVKLLIDDEKKNLYNLHNIGKSPIYMLFKFASNYFKNKTDVILLLTDNLNTTLLFNNPSNPPLIELYINNSLKIYSNVISLLIGYKVSNINNIKDDSIIKLIKNNNKKII